MKGLIDRRSFEMPYSDSGSTVFIPDSSTCCDLSGGNLILTTPLVRAESTGTNLNQAYILESDFVSHIHDILNTSIIIRWPGSSGTMAEFDLWAVKIGQSRDRISPWHVFTSNGYHMSLFEEVLASPADLNQCIIALVVKASGRNFESGTKDDNIIRSINTICKKKNY